MPIPFDHEITEVFTMIIFDQVLELVAIALSMGDLETQPQLEGEYRNHLSPRWRRSHGRTDNCPVPIWGSRRMKLLCYCGHALWKVTAFKVCCNFVTRFVQVFF